MLIFFCTYYSLPLFSIHREKDTHVHSLVTFTFRTDLCLVTMVTQCHCCSLPPVLSLPLPLLLAHCLHPPTLSGFGRKGDGGRRYVGVRRGGKKGRREEGRSEGGKEERRGKERREE